LWVVVVEALEEGVEVVSGVGPVEGFGGRVGAVLCRRKVGSAGIGKDAIAGVWADHNLKPWRVDTFKLSTDPYFEEKLVDVVGRPHRVQH